MQAAGYVLAGGRSTRMGRDKALLSWQGHPLLLHMLRLIEAAAGTAIVLGPASRYASLGNPVWDDLHPGLGPLGALETALSRTQADWNLLVSIDTPTISATDLKALLELTATTRAQAIVSVDPASGNQPGQPHPLCAVYHRNCLGTVVQSIAQRDLRMMNLLKKLAVYHLQLSAPLENLNSPEDWRRVEAATS
jgi:molybdopterin-guanine dinucleotide biosynthesis protein A